MSPMTQPTSARETVIAGGIVVDGTGAPGREGAIRISEGLVTDIRWGPGIPATGAAEVVDASGMVVCPGFIDVHGHSEFTLLADPAAQGRIAQGVTTEIMGNCGLSGGPLAGPYREHRQADLDEFGIKEEWSGLGEFLGLIEERRPAINVATLVGHGNLRGGVLGFGDRKPTDAELNQMQRLLSAGLDEGGIGLSAGLVYPPGVFSRADELVSLGAVAGRAGGLFAFHMRSEGDALCEAVEEVLHIGAVGRVPVHISHLKTAGESNWTKIDRVLEMIDGARRAGRSISADRYPYTASSTDLDAILPADVFDGGKREALRRLRDADGRRSLLRTLDKLWKDRWDRITVTSVVTSANRDVEGRTIAELARGWGCAAPDAVLRLLVEEEFRVGAVFHVMNEENLRKILSRPDVCIASDSAARGTTGITARGKPHPRGFGSFPRVLSWCVRERGWLGLEEAIRRMTSLGAGLFRLKRRGIIRRSFAADLVVFEPDRIRDRATYEDPFQTPEGVRDVWVNGVPALRDGRLTGRRAGAVLRGG